MGRLISIGLIGIGVGVLVSLMCGNFLMMRVACHSSDALQGPITAGQA